MVQRRHLELRLAVPLPTARRIDTQLADAQESRGGLRHRQRRHRSIAATNARLARRTASSTRNQSSSGRQPPLPDRGGRSLRPRTSRAGCTQLTRDNPSRISSDHPSLDPKSRHLPEQSGSTLSLLVQAGADFYPRRGALPVTRPPLHHHPDRMARRLGRDASPAGKDSC